MGGKRDRAIALQENFEKRKLMIGPHGGPRCFDFVAIRPFGCSEKVLSYTRTCKSAFYFFVVNYIFGWLFGSLLLTGHAKRQKAVKGKKKVKDEDQGGKGKRQSGKKNKRSKGN